MRLVFLNVTGSLGGAERVLLTLLGELRRLKPKWHLEVIAGDEGPLIEAVEALGCDVEVLPMGDKLRALGDWGATGKAALLLQLARALPEASRYSAALRSRLELLAPDVVQSNGFKMHLLGAMACPASMKLMWHVHDFVSSRTAMKKLLRWCSRKPAAVVAISPAVAKDLESVLNRSAKIKTIWNAVDLARFSGKAVPHQGIRIGMVATFARWKGHETFLQALALLPPELPWQGFIVGGEIYRRNRSQWAESELCDVARQLGIESRVEFTGFLADTAPIVRTFDIVVHASTEPEPFGLAIAEGMAAGCAVVTTSDAFVTDFVDGVVRRPGSPLNLEPLARDPVLRARLGTAARQTAEARFAPDRMAREFIALYEALA